LRQQLAVLRRLVPKRLRLTAADRIFWIWRRHMWSHWNPLLLLRGHCSRPDQFRLEDVGSVSAKPVFQPQPVLRPVQHLSATTSRPGGIGSRLLVIHPGPGLQRECDPWWGALLLPAMRLGEDSAMPSLGDPPSDLLLLATGEIEHTLRGFLPIVWQQNRAHDPH